MRVIDLQGRRFGRLLVIERAPIKNHFKIWRCLCDCGTECNVRSNELLRSNRCGTRSCGCLARESAKRRYSQMTVTHGDSRVAHIAPEFRCWLDFKQRCFNPRNRGFKNYGGRGITVCDEWRHSYEAFIAHVGRRPTPKHSIDRINNDGHYEPGNVRWATKAEQVNNKRHTPRQTAVHVLPGQRFGRLTIIEKVPHKSQRTAFACRCDCGGTTIIQRSSLLSGRSKSCGCLRRVADNTFLPASH
jgi:hypothetical protein